MMFSKQSVPMRCRRRVRFGFTIIEILVVVAIIALLVAILLPSLKLARETAQGSVCASQVKQMTTAGVMWIEESNSKRIPAHKGWANYLLKMLSGETRVFSCPTDEDPYPLPAVFISQHRTGYKYPTLQSDSAYFIHNDPVNGEYRIDMETEADVRGGDRNFNDAYVYYKPDSLLSPEGGVRAQRAGTGRELKLYNWKGRFITDIPSSGTDTYKAPFLWGSFGMNLSAVVEGAKPWNVIYAEYTDWTAVTERGFYVMGKDKIFRADDPNDPNEDKPRVAYRHNKKANIGFLDTHVERMNPTQLARPADEKAASVWHPQRPANWKPPYILE